MIGHRANTRTKQASAPILQAVKISILSHLLKANHPSSSSLLVLAGSGAPAPSVVGSLTYPPPPNGFRLLIEDKSPVDWLVCTGRSESRRDHPREFIESRNEEDAIVGDIERICWIDQLDDNNPMGASARIDWRLSNDYH
jgi:hypothetical protein